jgi:hypothetical protein
MLNFIKLLMVCGCLMLNACLSAEDDITKSIAYINNPQNNQEFYELVTLMEEMREFLMSYGIQIPPLTAILIVVRSKMIEDGVWVSDSIFEKLYAEFEAYEASYGTK